MPKVESTLVAGGVDPQALMLELARELDTARQDSTSLLESAEEIAKHIDSENASLARTRSGSLFFESSSRFAKASSSSH